MGRHLLASLLQLKMKLTKFLLQIQSINSFTTLPLSVGNEKLTLCGVVFDFDLQKRRPTADTGK